MANIEINDEKQFQSKAEERYAQYHVDNKTFKEIIKELKMNVDKLVAMAQEVGALKPGDHISYTAADGKEMKINRTTLRQFTKAYKDSLDELPKYHSESSRKRNPGAKKRKNNQQNDTPVIVDEDFKEFCKEADFGSIPDGKGGQIPLNSYLAPIIQSGVATQNIILSLLNIYAQRHQLRRNATINRGKSDADMNLGFYGADALMLKHFGKKGGLFDQLHDTDEELTNKMRNMNCYKDEKGNPVHKNKQGKGKPFESFDRNCFQHITFTSFSSLIKGNPEGVKIRSRDVELLDGSIEKIHATPNNVPVVDDSIQNVLDAFGNPDGDYHSHFATMIEAVEASKILHKNQREESRKKIEAERKPNDKQKNSVTTN